MPAAPSLRPSTAPPFPLPPPTPAGSDQNVQANNNDDGGADAAGCRRHRKAVSTEPDPRFWSGRNQVPRIESLWELYPNREGSSSSGGSSEGGGSFDGGSRGGTGGSGAGAVGGSAAGGAAAGGGRVNDAGAGAGMNGGVAGASTAPGGVRRRRRKNKTRMVVDPITGGMVEICDAKYAPPAEPARRPPEVYPPASWHQFMEELRTLTLKHLSFTILTFLLLNGLLGLPYSLSLLTTLGGLLSWYRSVASIWDDILHHAQTARGVERMHVLGAGNESAEWLNGTIAKLWPQVNADLFLTVVDLIEDVMQASIPGIVNEVKVTNVGQGTTPMRILAMRWLKEEEEVVVGGEEEGAGKVERWSEQEEVGEWACLEVSFAYRGVRSGASAASKAKNANLLVHLTLGLKGVVATPIPVWVELRGCTGTCRLKIQLIPDPPFVKLATFTLLGMPRIEIAAVPMNQRFFNVMNLPVISDFINSSIRTAARAYVAPSNYTLDLSKILLGSDSKHELLAIGVLVVHIHSATGIIAADLNGKSDCYVTLSYSKFAKPLWSTRIIFEDLNPVWDETAVLLVNADEVKAGEKLRVTLWDSDRFTADDIVGRTEVDVTELVRNRGKSQKRTDKLQGFTDGEEMPGRIEWSVVFHGKQELNNVLKTDGADERLPGDMRNAEELQTADNTADSEQEARVRYIPPDPAYPSGILSIQIHNIVALSRHSVAGSKHNPASRNGQSATIEEEESANLPSAYCSIILDQTKIYKTRVKPMSSKPFFNAGTERFVRDFRTSTVLIAVSDSRLRENDPLLGVVEFRLRDVLKNSSMISRYYPLQGGIGYGKIRVSLLFRSIDAVLPKTLLGSDTGTLEVVTPLLSPQSITDPAVRDADYIVFSTPLGSRRAPRTTDGNWSTSNIRLGVRGRHAVPCILYFRRDSKIRRDKTYAAAVLWLKDIPDDETTAVHLPVFRPADMDAFIQNCGEGSGVPMGWVDISVRFRRGLAPGSGALRRAAEEDRDFADVVEAERCVVHELNHPQHQHSNSSNSNNNLDDNTDSDDDAHEHPHHPQNPHPQNPQPGENENENDTKDSLMKRLSKRRDAQRELHRRERGVMQWKGARTLAWVGRGVKDAGKGVKGHFRMEPRRPNVETEVA